MLVGSFSYVTYHGGNETKYNPLVPYFTRAAYDPRRRLRSELCVLTDFKTSCTTFHDPEGRQNDPEADTVYGIPRVWAVCTPCDKPITIKCLRCICGSSIFCRSAILTPLLARMRRIYIKGISEYRPTVSFSIAVYALPRLSPVRNRWYWVYVEVLSSVKLSSDVFLTGFHSSRHRCL